MPIKAAVFSRKAAALAAVSALALLALVFHTPDAGEAPTAAPGARAAQATPAPAPAGMAAGPAAMSERPARVRALVEHVQLTDHTYCSYVAATRYPIASRPMSEQPDQAYPNAQVSETQPMRTEGGGTDSKIQIQSSQSRVFMAAGEAVAFSLRAVDSEGQALPLVVTRALARGLAYGTARPAAPVALAFADDGKGADPAAGDGAFAGLLVPAGTSLATFAGTIRTDVRYSVNGRSGQLQFDVIYSPELPATWSGPAREAVEGGSLVFYLKAEVRQAGRYIVSGRVDDAHGKPFALATFNEQLAQGPNEIRLTVFGKLMRDAEPAMPLTLRDVDGYLLRENVDPDRALLPRLEGKVLTARAHALKGFSDAEWQSEERSRYLAELGKDAAQARAALKEADPAAVVPSACAQRRMP